MNGSAVRRRAAAVLGALAVAVTSAALSTAAPAAAASERVVVQASSSTVAAAAVRAAGGRVVRALPVVDGVAAVLPAGARLPGLTVTPDEALVPHGNGSTDLPGTKSVYRGETAATALPPASRPVTVAVLDTGISDVHGLGAKTLSVPDPVHQGQTTRCANFSSETTCDDSYGHGTFLAGLIAGDEGMDPAARLVSIKIAGRNGSADVSQVLAGIQYAISFKDQLGIGVLNLSLGSDSTHDYRRDPLNAAVEKAWRAGIVVVVAASNRGPGASTISKPGDDPLVLTVGAVDDRETPAASDDVVPAFSGRGPVVEGTAGDTVTLAKPDVVAPGVGLISYDVAGSHIAQTAGPSSYGVPGFRRGSGTSQATAVTSGAAALLLERRTLTPDEVKAALVRSAVPVASTDRTAVGAGLVQVAGALTADVSGAAQPDPQRTGNDGLDASRAHLLVTGAGCGLLDVYRTVDPQCDHVHGDTTAQGRAFDPSDPSGQSWYSSQWASGQSWYGQSWYGQSWYGQSWYGYDGTSSSEGETTPLGTVLPGSAWYGVWR